MHIVIVDGDTRATKIVKDFLEKTFLGCTVCFFEYVGQYLLDEGSGSDILITENLIHLSTMYDNTTDGKLKRLYPEKRWSDWNAVKGGEEFVEFLRMIGYAGGCIIHTNLPTSLMRKDVVVVDKRNNNLGDLERAVRSLTTRNPT